MPNFMEIGHYKPIGKYTSQTPITHNAIIVDMRKRFSTLVLAVILLAACGTGSAESGIEVNQVKMGAGAQGEDRAVYLT